MSFDLILAQQNEQWNFLANTLSELGENSMADICTYWYILSLIASGRVTKAKKPLQLHLIQNYFSSRFFFLYSSLFSQLSLTSHLAVYTSALAPPRQTPSSIKNVIMTLLRMHRRTPFEQV